MRSWLSEMASSVPSRPSYFLVTVSRSMYRPSAQLAHGNGDAAGAKVVAALDQAAGVAAAEQTLQLALDRGVALLDLGAAGLDGLGVLGLGGAGGTADAVTAGAAAQQDDLVAGGGALAAHVVCRGSAHNGADLHALGHVAGVIELVDLAGGKADLVAVAGVAGGSGGYELALRQLALERLGHGDGGVAAPVTRMAWYT